MFKKTNKHAVNKTLNNKHRKQTEQHKIQKLFLERRRRAKQLETHTHTRALLFVEPSHDRSRQKLVLLEVSTSDHSIEQLSDLALTLQAFVSTPLSPLKKATPTSTVSRPD